MKQTGAGTGCIYYLVASYFTDTDSYADIQSYSQKWVGETAEN